jgi:hypothetical protein
MSRTRKDRPYWVRLNQDARYTDHNHEAFGRENISYRTVLDKNGAPITKTIEFYTSIYELARYGTTSTITGATQLRYYTMRHERPGTDKALWTVDDAKARLAEAFSISDHTALRRQVPYQRIVREEREPHVTSVMPDYCTEGVKLSGSLPHWRELPCTPELGNGDPGYWGYARDMSNAKKFYSRARYGRERASARTALSKTALNWNNGYEVEDWDTDTDLTSQHRHSMNWDLW